jgi:8-oxo-dGTP diphosphatase
MINCTFENGDQVSLRHVTVGCLVIKDGKILLCKRAEGLLEAGKWGLLGGFAERDETTIQTGIRETMEESGWVIDNLRLLRLNDSPNRPHEDRQNIDFIYVADAIGEKGKPSWESAELKWFPLDDIPADEHIAFDHADSIGLYKKYVQQEFPLPVLGPIAK